MSTETQCTLYAEGNFQGDSIILEGETKSLKEKGFQDKPSSAKVVGRPWIFYNRLNFRLGKSYVVQPAEYPSPDPSWGHINDVSSLRPLPSESDGDAVIALFQYRNYCGRMLVLTTNEVDLSKFQFNNKASSLIVIKGTWTVYRHTHYEQDIGTYVAGSYIPELKPNNAVSSVKVIDEPVQCIFYKDVEYEGESLTVDGATSSLVDLHFNDKASSARVMGSPWVFYQHKDFLGKSHLLQPGDYLDPYSWGGPNDDLSSLRPLPSASMGEGVIALFEHSNYCGRMLVLTSSAPKFVKPEFNDTAGSLVVIKGNWSVYKDIDYGQAVGTYGAGSYVPLLAPNDKVSSAKLD